MVDRDEGGVKGVEREDGFHPTGDRHVDPPAQPPLASQQAPAGSYLHVRILNLPYILLQEFFVYVRSNFPRFMFGCDEQYMSINNDYVKQV